MEDDVTTTVPQETGALIDHILANYHEMHRADLASLVPLAERVEQVHADDPEVPRGLACALGILACEMEDHMTREEIVLIPATRANHDDHAGTIAPIRQLTRDLTPPEHACGSWRSLYGRVATFLDALAAHIALENDVLFPRFEPAT